MRKRGWLPGLLMLLAAGAAGAAELGVRVADREGRPVADAVVVLQRRGGGGPDAPAPATHNVDQKDLTFLPYVQLFRPGDAVVFHNSDTTRHHVYSFSPARSFEFVLAPGQSGAPLTLEAPGVVAVGCNIHDGMISYLYVSDAPWMARSGADGRVRFDGLPAGEYDVQVWHPRLPPMGAPPGQTGVALAADARPTLTFSLRLLPDLRRPGNHEQTHY
jgi:plastocyanin